jgi:hypothetical protein
MKSSRIFSVLVLAGLVGPVMGKNLGVNAGLGTQSGPTPAGVAVNGGNPGRSSPSNFSYQTSASGLQTSLVNLDRPPVSPENKSAEVSLSASLPLPIALEQAPLSLSPESPLPGASKIETAASSLVDYMSVPDLKPEAKAFIFNNKVLVAALTKEQGPKRPVVKEGDVLFDNAQSRKASDLNPVAGKPSDFRGSRLKLFSGKPLAGKIALVATTLGFSNTAMTTDVQYSNGQGSRLGAFAIAYNQSNTIEKITKPYRAGQPAITPASANSTSWGKKVLAVLALDFFVPLVSLAKEAEAATGIVASGQELMPHIFLYAIPLFFGGAAGFFTSVVTACLIGEIKSDEISDKTFKRLLAAGALVGATAAAVGMVLGPKQFDAVMMSIFTVQYSVSVVLLLRIIYNWWRPTKRSQRRGPDNQRKAGAGDGTGNA